MKLFGSKKGKSGAKDGNKAVINATSNAALAAGAGAIGVVGIGLIDAVKMIVKNAFAAVRWLVTTPDGREIISVVTRWIPFMIMMALGYVILMNAYHRAAGVINTDAVDIGVSEIPSTTPEITPVTPPVIYERGLTPRPNKDDRIPLSALSKEYELNDPHLPQKLSGVGRISISKDKGRFVCTASLVGRRDFVVTASHCLVGAPWQRMTPKTIGKRLRFYSVACNAWYRADAVYVRTKWPIVNIDKDFAFIRLSEPVCRNASPFQAITLTDAAAKTMRKKNYPLLSVSVFPFGQVRRSAEFSTASAAASRRKKTLTTFGVFCRFSKLLNNVSGPDKTMIYFTDGCDTFKGNSGGPLLASLDGGKTYGIIGTLFGCDNPDCFVRVKGGFAADIERKFVEWFGGGA